MIKILAIPGDLHGVGHYRTIWPAQSLDRLFPGEFSVEINPQPDFNNFEYLNSFDIILCHRTLGPSQGMKDLTSRLRTAPHRTIVIMDLDDYWMPSQNHPLYEIVRKEGLPEQILSNLQLADHVTTTTDIFAGHIAKHNPNVHVFPNAIDSGYGMWKTEAIPSDLCRIAAICGSSHLHSLMILKDDITKIYNSPELKGKFQFVLCGFDTRGNVTETFQDGTQRTRNILPHETVWCRFEEIFTDNYNGLKDYPEYVKYLKKVTKGDFNTDNVPYVRRWTLPLTQYARHYDYCDILLAPLEEKELVKDPSGNRWKTHMFNEAKSELKVIEAGMKHKALICQDFGIYSQVIEDGVTGLLVNSKDKNGWYKAMKKLILDPDMRMRLADNLQKFVRENYEIDDITRKRAEFYKGLIIERDNPTLVLEGVIQHADPINSGRIYSEKL